MKTRLIPALITLLLTTLAFAQPPQGFDQEKPVPHGKVESITYPSKALGFDRPATVYLPPGYDPAKKYPVLYLLHGSGDDEKGWLTKGAAATILDNLYAAPAAKVTPMIVVMPWGYAIRQGTKPPPTTQREARAKISRAFEDEVTAELVPFIDAKYPTIPDAQHRAIAGLSMGGGHTLRVGLTHLDTFAWLGCMSSMLRDPMPENVAKILDDAPATNAKIKLFYYSAGDKDKSFDAMKAFHETLDKKGIKHLWSVKSGTHEWKVWRESLHELAPLLFK
jgi:enterochelin esterase-like enzyme